MTTYLVTRHPGALQWMRQHGMAFDRHVTHLDLALVHTGDCVVGTLPIHLAAQVCARGASYWHLSLHLPETARGSELSEHEMQALGATLQQFHVTPQKVKPAP